MTTVENIELRQAPALWHLRSPTGGPDQEKKTSAAYNEYRIRNMMQNGLFMGLDLLDGSGLIWGFGDSREGWGHDVNWTAADASWRRMTAQGTSW